MLSPRQPAEPSAPFSTPRCTAPTPRRVPNSPCSPQKSCGRSGRFAARAEKQLLATAGGATRRVISKTKHFCAAEGPEPLAARVRVKGTLAIQMRFSSPLLFPSALPPSCCCCHRFCSLLTNSQAIYSSYFPPTAAQLERNSLPSRGRRKGHSSYYVWVELICLFAAQNYICRAQRQSRVL